MAKGKTYYAKSMVVTRLTGIPYRLNDVTINARNGRVLVRSESAKRMGLTEGCFAFLAEPSLKGLIMEVWQTPAMRANIKKVAGQSNMQFYSRDMARRWRARLGKEEMRLSVVSVFRRSQDCRLVTLQETNDIASKYKWASRKKKV